MDSATCSCLRIELGHKEKQAKQI